MKLEAKTTARATQPTSTCKYVMYMKKLREHEIGHLTAPLQLPLAILKPTQNVLLRRTGKQ